eukprot:scaffold227_cov71-Skeletonema_menzelii.AAC.7
MKFITIIVAVAITSLAYGRKSEASTKSAKSKSAKSKSSKARCIDGSLSLASSTKPGKAQLSLSMSHEKDVRCQPCSFGSGVYNYTCGTDAGFCEFGRTDPAIVDRCDANGCAPECFWLEPTCESCSMGPLLGVTCPQNEDGSNCLFTFSADAEPICVISSDCVSDNNGDSDSCGLCSKAPASLGCPSNAEGYCQVNFPADGVECVQCNSTACPSFKFDQCADPPAPSKGVRSLEMGNEGWGFNTNFQW